MSSIHYCIICGREFRPARPDIVICPFCGGPPEAQAAEQRRTTASSCLTSPQVTIPDAKARPQETAGVDAAGELRFCIVCGREFRAARIDADKCHACGGPLEATEDPLDKIDLDKPQVTLTDDRPATSQHTIAVQPESISSSSETSAVSARTFAAEADVPLQWNKGDTILDLYEVKGLLGEGGMGAVYRVHHTRWNLDLAVKTPKPEALEKAGGLESFIGEAEAWMDLGLHPHIVTCYYVRTLGGIPRVFAEFVEGGSLKEWIRDRRLYAGGEREALQRILDVAIQFAWGLGYAHEKGMVHQDVKPANALMTPDGTLKVTDFGLVKSKGYTAVYAAPEQILGKDVDARTDIWCWGVSVLEMFIGECTWRDADGSIAAYVLDQYLSALPADLPRMPQGVADLLRDCFQNDLALRPPNMDAVAERLMAVYQQEFGEPYPREKPNPLDLRADSLNNHAVSYLDLGRYDEGREFLRQALEADLQHPEATYNLLLLEWQQGNMTGAEVTKRLEDLLRRSSNPWPIAYLLGLVHLKTGNLLKALETIAKIYLPELRGEQPFAWVVAVDRNDFEQALEILLEIARDADPKYPDIVETLERMKLLPPSEIRLIRDFDAHAEGVTCVTFSPDDRFCLSGGADNTLKLWDWLGTCLRVFQGHQDCVTAITFDPKGDFILSSSKDRTLKLWNVANGKCLHTFEGHLEAVNSLAVNHSGSQVISGSDDGTLKLWDIQTGRCLYTLKTDGSVKCVSFSPDDKYVAAGVKNTIVIWQREMGRQLCTIRGHDLWVTCLSFTPDGQFIISGSADKTLRLWDINAADCKGVFKSNVDWPVSSVAIRAGGKRAFSSQGPYVFMWNIETGECILTLEKYNWSVSSVAISSDGSYVLIGSARNLNLWIVEESADFHIDFYLCKPFAIEEIALNKSLFLRLVQQCQRALDSGNYPYALQLARKARSVSGYERDERGIGVWQELSSHCCLTSLQGVYQKQILYGHEFWIWSVTISPCGSYVLSGGFDKTARLWNIETGSCLRVYETKSSTINAVAFSPDGRYLILGGFNLLELWDIQDWKRIREFEYKKRVDAVTFSPDGHYVLSGGWDDHTLRLWSVKNGKCLRIFKGHEGQVVTVSFSPDGLYILSGSYDGTVRLWDVPRGTCIYTYENHKKELPDEFDVKRSIPVTSVAFCPDGKHAISSSLDGTIQLWDIKTKKTVNILKGNEGFNSISLSPNGRYVLSGNCDGNVQIWDLETNKCPYEFRIHRNITQSVAFSQNGRYVVSAGWDKAIYVWTLDWELEYLPADWDEGARPYLDIFLTLHTPYGPDGLSRVGAPQWTEEDFQKLLRELGIRGYGWLRPEGVRRELEKMARERGWKGR